MINKRFYKKILTPAEAGKKGTHETYIRLSNDFDYESFFQQTGYMNGSVLQIDFEAKDLCEGHEGDKPIKFKFIYYKNSNHEKRIPSLGDFFKDHGIHEGDIIVLESRTQNDKTEFFFSHFKPSEMVLKPDTIYYTETIQDDIKYTLTDNSKKGLQEIYYGAPGTGKSYGIKKVVGTKDGSIREDNNIRITFHPDTDYASFVGCYKPQQDEREGKEDNIVYRFQPEAFVNAYLAAWQRMCAEKQSNFYLIIEEINRGNCAQIFGDMFQLLDRDDNGYSSYKVSTELDLRRYLKDEINKHSDLYNGMPEDLKSGEWMQLPPTLSIIATMNTSDQSLFPMDSAFKRRWDWNYVKIDTTKVSNILIDIKGIRYKWCSFVEKINECIQEETGSTAKQIGPWFAKADVKANPSDKNATIISYDNFRSKVLFFLFNDAFRDYDSFGERFRSEDDKNRFPFLFENLFSGVDDGVACILRFMKSIEAETDEPEQKASSSQSELSADKVDSDNNEND